MKPRLIVWETIYGGGNSVIGMFKRLQRDYPSLKNELIICHSEDAGRTDAMGAQNILEQNSATPQMAKAFLEVAARAKICRSVIMPALAQNKIVLCKNFTLASRVGYRLNFPDICEVMMKNEEMARGDICPDLTIFIDWPPESSYERLNRDDLAHFDGIDFYRKMRNLYLEELENLPRDQVIIIAPQADNDATWSTLKPLFDEILFA